MPTKRAILAQLTAKELRASSDNYELHVDDRRVKAQLVDVLAGSRKVRLDELLPGLSRNRLKELCRAFNLDDSGRKKADLVARLVGPAPVLKIDRGQAPPAVSRPVAETPVLPAETQGATTGHEAELWRMADALRGSMDAAEYKHVVLGLIFLKYISDAFEEMHARLEGEQDEGADLEDPDEYRAKNIFWVPPEARWSHLKAQAKQPVVGRLVDDAMAAIERDNSVLKDVLPKDYARPALDKQRLGQLIDMISNIRVGDADARSKDVLGRVYEYFLSQFASAEGKKGGEFYTPRCIVKLLVEMLEPWRGRVYDPCCGSSGMFVQSVEFIRAHATGNGNGGKARGDISVYGQESNYTTWRLAKMNLAIRGIEGQIAHGDSFQNDRHPDLRADFILANPPFNVSDWGGERLTDDKRWQHGVSRPRATPTSPGCSTSCITSRRRARLALCLPTAPCRPPSRARAKSGRTSSKRTWWTAWWRCRASFSTRPRFPPACGSSPATGTTADSATAAAKCCSSMPARWAAWSTEPTAS